MSVEDAPDFAGLPTCLITVQGRKGKRMKLNFTEHYCQVHKTWNEVDEQNEPT